jgi:hypothetical protein
MTILTRPLTEGWQLNYDTEARLIFVSSSGGQELPIDDFLARESEARIELELLIMDMFPNNADDVNGA